MKKRNVEPRLCKVAPGQLTGRLGVGERAAEALSRDRADRRVAENHAGRELGCEQLNNALLSIIDNLIPLFLFSFFFSEPEAEVQPFALPLRRRLLPSQIFGAFIVGFLGRSRVGFVEARRSRPRFLFDLFSRSYAPVIAALRSWLSCLLLRLLEYTIGAWGINDGDLCMVHFSGCFRDLISAVSTPIFAT